MEVPVLCSTEEFIAKSNAIIKPPFEASYYSACSIYSEHSRLEREKLNETLANALDLASAICSMMLRPSSTNELFGPYIQINGKRSAIPDDFTTEQLKFVASVCGNIDEPMVKARFADLLWVCVNPKEIDYARSAIQLYLMLPIHADTWHSDIGDCWKRCIRLALQIRDSYSISLIEAKLLSAFEKEYPDSPYMHLWIAELIEDQRLCIEQH
jgi:hypothetical protein